MTAKIDHNINNEIIQDNEQKKLCNKDIIEDYIKKSVGFYDVNIIELGFGNKINDIIFDNRLNYKSNTINHFDLVPLINSLITPFVETKDHIKFKKIQIINYEDSVYIINKCLSSNKLDYNYYQNNLEDYNITDSFCIKSKKLNYKNSINFTNMKTYNHSENYLLIEWLCKNDIKINLKVYKTYLCLSMEINVIEKNKIPYKKMNMINKIFDILELIYTNYLKN